MQKESFEEKEKQRASWVWGGSKGGWMNKKGGTQKMVFIELVFWKHVNKADNEVYHKLKAVSCLSLTKTKWSLTCVTSCFHPQTSVTFWQELPLHTVIVQVCWRWKAQRIWYSLSSSFIHRTTSVNFRVANECSTINAFEERLTKSVHPPLSMIAGFLLHLLVWPFQSYINTLAFRRVRTTRCAN